MKNPLQTTEHLRHFLIRALQMAGTDVGRDRVLAGDCLQIAQLFGIEEHRFSQQVFTLYHRCFLLFAVFLVQLRLRQLAHLAVDAVQFRGLHRVGRQIGVVNPISISCHKSAFPSESLVVPHKPAVAGGMVKPSCRDMAEPAVIRDENGL